LINVDFEPCPYQLFTSMGILKKARGWIRQFFVIQVNPNKPTKYTMKLRDEGYDQDDLLWALEEIRKKTTSTCNCILITKDICY
jgi:hypothetical protein